MAEPIIEVRELTKVYGSGDAQVSALAGVNASVAAGEFVAVMGPPGSGKSTLMNILGCLDVATSGAYLLNGRDVNAQSRDDLAHLRNQVIGFVFQGF